MKKAFAIVICFMIVMTTASAHPGRTDSNGGHWDHSTGEYHYHHGYPAHQHTDGICPYNFDDQTGVNSGDSSSSGSSSGIVTSTDKESDASNSETADSSPVEPEVAPEGYPDAVNYEIAIGSKLIDRTYYFNENGFMYIPWTKENLPHGDVETDNTEFLQFGHPYIGDVIYKYGLENQSHQFQEGATFGLHEAQCYYDQWYQYGYEEGQKSTLADTTNTYDSAYNDGYDDGFNDGINEGNSQGYDTGYRDAENKYQLIVIVTVALACILFGLLLYSRRKANDELKEYHNEYKSLQKSYDEQIELTEEERQGWSQALQAREAEIQRLQSQMVNLQANNSQQIRPQDKSSLKTVNPQTEKAQVVRSQENKEQAVPSNDTHMMTFAGWKPEVHQTQAQWERFQRSNDPHMMLIGMAGNRYKVQGLSGIYDVTLNSCNCPDFLSNLHGQAPCKHIYFLARQLQIPVDAIFNDSFRNGQKPE